MIAQAGRNMFRNGEEARLEVSLTLSVVVVNSLMIRHRTARRAESINREDQVTSAIGWPPYLFTRLSLFVNERVEPTRRAGTSRKISKSIRSSGATRSG